MNIERTKNATRNIFFGGILKIYQILMPFLMRTVILYFLGVQYLGLNSLFTSVLQVLNLAELGIGSAMVYSMYKPIADDDSVRICALMRLYRIYYWIIGGVIAIVGIVVTPFIPYLVKGNIPTDVNLYILYLMNLALTVLSYWLFAYKNSLFQAHQRLDIPSKINLITSTVQYVFQIIVLICFRNYYAYVIVALMTQAATNIITAIEASKLYPQYNPEGKLSKQSVNEINCKIRDLFTAKLGGVILSSADTLVISAFLGLTELAVYQNYYYIMNSVVGFIFIFLNSCTAGIGNSLIVESIEKNLNDFKKLLFLLEWITSICVCCFLCIYQPFMIIWVGVDYLLPNGCVILFCIYFYCHVINYLFCVFKDAAGIWHEDRFRPLCGSIINLLLNLLLVKQLGIFAIILSTIISYVFVSTPWLIHNLFTLLFKCSFKDVLMQILCYTIVIAISAVFTYKFSQYVQGGVFNILLRLLICIILPSIIFFASFKKQKECKESIDLINNITKYKFNKILSRLN